MQRVRTDTRRACVASFVFPRRIAVRSRKKRNRGHRKSPRASFSQENTTYKKPDRESYMHVHASWTERLSVIFRVSFRMRLPFRRVAHALSPLENKFSGRRRAPTSSPKRVTRNITGQPCRSRHCAYVSQNVPDVSYHRYFTPRTQEIRPVHLVGAVASSQGGVRSFRPRTLCPYT